MNRAIVSTIFRKELLDTLRDKRTLIAMIGVPIFLYPVLILLLGEIMVSRVAKVAETDSRIAIVAEDRATVETWFGEAEQILVTDSENPESDLQAGVIDAIVRVPDPVGEALSGESTLKITVEFDVTESGSRQAIDRIEDVLREREESILDARLARETLPESFVNPFELDFEAVEEDTKRAGFMLGLILPMIVVMMMALGCFYPAVDLTAGEKERGTFETLLSTPASKADILAGKFCTVVTIGLITGFLNVLSSGLTIWIYLNQIARIGGDSAPDFANQMLSIPPGRIVLMVLMLLPLAFIISALMMAVAVTARSFKDAQNYMTPVLIGISVPAALGVIPDLELSGPLRFVPIGNVMLLIREMMMGQASLDDTFVVLLCTTVYALIALLLAVWVFQREDVILSEERGLPLTLHRAEFLPQDTPTLGLGLGIFATAMLLIMYAGITLQSIHLYWGLFITEYGLILAPVLAILWFTRTRIKTALSLNAASWRTWLGTVLIVPGWVVISLQIGVWNDRALPLPEGFEDFALTLLSIGETPLGLALLIFLVGVTPAICEEALFRGAIVSGLREGLPDWAIVIVTGVLFGMFHLSLYRFLPTAATGLVLTYIAVRGKSIFPAMLLHGAFNTMLLLLQLDHAPEGIVKLVAQMETAEQGVPLPYLLPALALVAAGVGLIEIAARKKPA